MVKQRREEAHIAESHELGRKNVEILAAARGWCKHLQVEMTSYGLLAEMSGLPIGSHDVSCPHAKQGLGGMNLPMILPHFVVENCRGCPSHTPNGGTEWGDRVIADYETRCRQANERQAQLAAQLEEVRAKRRTLVREAHGQADFTAHRILELTESLFSENEDERSAASASLQQAAGIASELFHPAAVDLILASAPQHQLGELCLPVVAALAGRRPDLADRFVSFAVEVIDTSLPLEPACEILIGCGCGASRPVPAGVIDKVVKRQNHLRPIGGWPTRDPSCPLVDIPPTYVSSTALLVGAYDQNPDSVVAPLRAEFQDNNKFRRVNACGVAGELLNQRPAVGVALLPVIVSSLELDDDVYNDSADSEACALIAKVFIKEPTLTDGHLRERFEQQSREAQALTADAYQRVLRTDWVDGLDKARFDEAIALAFQRCLAFMQDQRIDLDVRDEFADAIESACRHHPDLAMANFDTLLGALACLCAQEEPPDPLPRIILSSELPSPPLLRALEQDNRRIKWSGFKNTVAKCLERLARERPRQAAEKLFTCFAGLDSKTHESLKARIVILLGELGRDRDLLPRVLPLLWVALMDYGSVLIRCRGVEAITRCFEHADCDPPPDVVEALILHLKDTYKIVHQAAIRAIRWHTRWLTREQAEDAIQQLAGWASTYRKKESFKLDEICRPLLSLSHMVPEMRYSAVRFVTGLLPTGEFHVDLELIEMLTDDVEPCEEGAHCVVPQAGAWLAGHRRESLSDHADDTREQVYGWLRSLKHETYMEGRESLLKVGSQLAASGDIWSTLRFAAVFTAFEDFQAEAEVLGRARASLPQGRRYERVIQTFGELEKAALENGRRVQPAREQYTHE